MDKAAAIAQKMWIKSIFPFLTFEHLECRFFEWAN